MDVATPCCLPSSPRDECENNYEEDLMALLNDLSLDEMTRIQARVAHSIRAGDPLSDDDVALNDLVQQAHALVIVNRDRVLAHRIAAGGDPGADERLAQQVAMEPQPNGNGDPTGHDCIVCKYPIHGTEITAPCGHHYGIDCLTYLFHSSTRDETLFPPRCCKQNIPLDQVKPHLSQEVVTAFQQKEVEYSIPQRVYCSSPACSRFLGPLLQDVRKAYTCAAPECATETCAKCRSDWGANGLHDCVPDATIMQVFKLARAAGWARCPGCSQMIEKRTGCNHMMCRCRTQFCYRCSARWKTCRCS